MFAAASDPLIWAGHPEKDRHTEARFRGNFEAVLRSRGALAIIDNATRRIVGRGRYHCHDTGRRQVEIGTFLVRRCWGGPINGEVKRLMIDHAFRFVDTVRLAVAESNMRARRACEKIGATLAGTGEMRMMSGRLIPHCIYEVRLPVPSRSAQGRRVPRSER